MKEDAMRTRLILIAATWATVVGLVVGSAHAQAQPGGQFSLIGVVMLEGGRDLAFIQEPSLTNDKVVTVRLGDNVGPYRVTKILTHQVELTGPAGTVVIPLAGLPGAVGVAATSSAGGPPAKTDLTTSPSSPDGVIIPRGDPRRQFPMDKLVPGGGGVMSAAALAKEQQLQNALQSKQAAQAGLDPAAMQPQTPGSNQNIVIPRGDPRRLFPFSSMFIGYGAKTTGAP
jgi:hypothetical protein